MFSVCTCAVGFSRLAYEHDVVQEKVHVFHEMVSVARVPAGTSVVDTAGAHLSGSKSCMCAVVVRLGALFDGVMLPSCRTRLID